MTHGVTSGVCILAILLVGAIVTGHVAWVVAALVLSAIIAACDD